MSEQTRQTRRREIARQLIASPGLSNRSIARAVGAGHPLVGTIRAELETEGRIPVCRASGGRGVTTADRLSAAAIEEIPDDDDSMRVEIRCHWFGHRGPVSLALPAFDLPRDLPSDDPQAFAQAIGKAALRWARSRT